MIASGTRFGPYEIAAQLGAGGMGEVYRARDSRLDRSVAIKILPRRFSSDPRLRERFEREARAISALSHPHICTLYDVGSHDGVEFLVMEYLDGESLADRIERGPLPLEQVVRYGIEIAEALDKAHRAGIVHRDLKPGNVIAGKNGAKLLDFGLAKFSQPMLHADPNAETAAMMAQNKPLTEEGTLLGTFQYMAPEQIEGHDADARTDIFALGTLLYEMATGKRAFEAKSKASLIASILDREPAPLATFQPLTPPALERVIRLCLMKDPDDRWQSAHDIAAALRWIGEVEAAPKKKRVGMRALALASIAGLLLGAGALFVVARATRERAKVARFDIAASASLPLSPYSPYSRAIAIAPDASRIAYRTLVNGQSRVVLRSLQSGATSVVAGTEDSGNFVFSPDGKWLASTSDETGLWKIPLDGGRATRLFPGAGLGTSWTGDALYVTRGFTGGIWRVPQNGGTATQVVTLQKGMRAAVWPDVLPDKTIIATSWRGDSWDKSQIVAFTPDGKQHVLIDGGFSARYAPTGHLLYMSGGNLMGVRFDAKSHEISGTPIVVVHGVSNGIADGEAQYDFTPAGDLVYIPGPSYEAKRALVAIDRAGRETPLVPTLRSYGSVRMSADGQSALVALEAANYDVWQLDLERDSLMRVSFGGDDSAALWTPDGHSVIWSSTRTGPQTLWWRNGDGPEEQLGETAQHRWPSDVSPDGKRLLYWDEQADANIGILDLATKKTQTIAATPFFEGLAVFSPDGNWIAYQSNESGRMQVYVRALDGSRRKMQVSIDGGDHPHWSPDGREVIYLHDDAFLAVNIETAPRPRAGRPHVLYRGHFDPDFDVARDGRIIAIRYAQEQTTTNAVYVQHWFEELERLVP